jgi:class 3 adenylate cyclase/tetratricopeptide (TPR) repeat protein
MVTVLFADLVGFTSLAESEDPESVKRLIDGCFELLVDDIVSFGGGVDKLLGDGIVALFGAPIAHEDDAERAVRAALRMQRTVAAYAAHRRRPKLQMRIGINTGEVLTGTVAGSDYTAMGDVVNTAARLQGVASPGTVVVGSSTYSLTHHIIRYDEASPVQLRGRDEPVEMWTAIEETAPPGGGRRRRTTGVMVGRVHEMASASALLDLAARDKHCVVITVTGDSGVGKQRFVDELLRVRETNDVTVLRGACAPYGEANIWWPIASALNSHLDIDINAPVDEIRTVAAQRAQALGDHLSDDDVERISDTFLHLLGLPSPLDRLDPTAARGQVQSVVHQVVALRCHIRPLVLAISDMQWADTSVVELLDQLAVSLHRSALAIVTTLRPGTDTAWPVHHERVSNMLLHLHPLSAQESAQLATMLLGEQPAPPELLSALYDRSGGNPLFIEELTALAARGRSISQLPDSLRALIGARLDELTREQRQVIDNAATLGTSGIIGALQRFASELGQTFDPSVLDELEDLGLLEQRGRRWSFRSDSLRDTAYQTLTKATRAQRHAGVARVLTPPTPATADDQAHHLGAAAELVRELGRVQGVPSTIVDEAIDALGAAAQRATKSGASSTGVRFATRALDLLPSDDDPRRLALLLTRAELLIERRAARDAAVDVHASLQLAIDQHDLPAEATARVLGGRLAQIEGRLDEARRELDLAISLWRAVDRPDKLAAALRARGFAELFGGSPLAAEPAIDEAKLLAEAHGDERGAALADQLLAWASFLGGNTAAARNRLQTAADTLDRLDDRNGVGWANGLLAFVEYIEGNFAAAEALATSVAAEAQERGDEWATSMMQVLLADLRLWTGSIAEARQLADQARRRLKKIGDSFGLLQATAPLLRAQVALGQHDQSQRIIEELQVLLDHGSTIAIPAVILAGALVHRGDGEQAVVAATEALRLAEAGGVDIDEVAIVLALAHLQAGHIDEATVAVQRVEKPHPFSDAVGALVSLATAHVSEARQQAERSLAGDGASYLDGVLANIAKAAAATRMGEVDAARQAADVALATARRSGDVIAVALSSHARARVGSPGAEPEASTDLTRGWHTVLNLIFSAN